MAKRVESFADRLTKAMQAKHISAAELSMKTKYSKASISQWVNGIHEAKQAAVYQLAAILDVNEAWLMGFDVSMERNPVLYGYDDRYSSDGCASDETSPFGTILSRIPLYDLPVSAGTGVWLAEGHEYEYVDFENVPPHTDFALRVRGDSMEPLYSDDDIVFVRQNMLVEGGHVGIFFLNGEGYMKMLQGNKLVSLNNKYKPVIVQEEDLFFICGRVVGKATEPIP